ncbi:MAG: hypothetical protein KC635_12380, partial [Myxococcales bacterium]|nr:hypothetical protein [Myxococcales bacterium]
MNDTTARLEAVERALHEVLTVDELGGAPLALLEDALGSSQSLLYAYGFQGQPLMLGGRLRERALADYGPEIFLRDPLHPYMRAKSPRFLLRPDGHTHEEVARSDAYAAFYGPAEADHYLGIWPTSLPYGAPGMFGVFLARSRRSGTFDDRALDVLTRLEPAFRVMARRVARVARLERARAALLAAAG